MIPEGLNRVIFEILQRARGENVTVYSIDFGERLVGVGRDVLLRRVIMKQA
jgi:hypothetical protein